MSARRAVLDTSVLLDPPDDLGAFADEVCVCTLSFAELATGLHPRDHVEAARRAEAYALLAATFPPIGFSAQAARLYGALCATAKDAGHDQRPGRFEVMIAAVAVAEHLPLITARPAGVLDLQPAVTVIDASARRVDFNQISQ